jgi:uncharacterized protein with NRDE domain
MCLLGLYVPRDPSGLFIAVHNRDEELGRVTGPLALHGPALYCKDIRGGGTWMGLNVVTGVFVTLTNVRRALPPASDGVPQRSSRGLLVVKLLTEDCSFLDSAASASSIGGKLDLSDVYGGFNCVIARLHSTTVLTITNCHSLLAASEPTTAWAEHVAPGSHAMSNSFFNDESWAKVRHVRSGMERLGRAFDVTASDVRHVPLSAPLFLADLLEKLSNLMLHALPIQVSDSFDLSWSPLPPSEELFLQQHVFVPPIALAGFLEATQATTVVVKIPELHAIAYCLRNHSHGHEGVPAGDHSVHVLPPTSASTTTTCTTTSALSLPVAVESETFTGASGCGHGGSLPPNVTRLEVETLSEGCWQVYLCSY